VTRAYDDALRPVGLHVTQLAVLVAVGTRLNDAEHDGAAGLNRAKFQLTIGPI
jgi:hypothetical protein